MDKLTKLLNKEKFVIVDGAMATELEARGCNINDELWSAKILSENPALIEQVHYDYFASGADIGISASYQASIPGFMNKGFTKREGEKLIMDSMEILLNAVKRYQKDYPERNCLIAAAAVGPYGAYLADGSEYRGDYTADKAIIEAFHRERMELLASAGAEIFACETLPCLWEAEVILKIAEDLDVPCWVSFSCKDGNQISDGTPIEECARFMNGKELVKAVGVNCTHPRFISELIKNIKNSCDQPVIVYPNKGEEYDPLKKVWVGAGDIKSFRDYAEQWYEDGARLIGGCCRTTPEDIRQLERLRKSI